MPRQRMSAKRRPPARKRRGAEQPPEHDDYPRGRNTLFEFWRVCAEPRCRRAHACLGEPNPCFNRHWAMIPEQDKVWFRAAVKARIDGHSLEQAGRIGDAEVKRWKEIMGEDAEPPAADPAPAPRDERTDRSKGAAADASPLPRLRAM